MNQLKERHIIMLKTFNNYSSLDGMPKTYNLIKDVVFCSRVEHIFDIFSPRNMKNHDNITDIVSNANLLVSDEDYNKLEKAWEAFSLVKSEYNKYGNNSTGGKRHRSKSKNKTPSFGSNSFGWS